MDFGESIQIALQIETRLECPFHEPAQDDPNEEPEGIEDDDLNEEDPKNPQKNNGQKLGKNLESGSPGAEEYLGKTPCRADTRGEDKRSDSTCGDDKGKRLPVFGKEYPYVVAAHHLIPGNGSLAGDDPSDLYDYMCRKKIVQGRTISKNIGYCVNGAHNGVWLPGNYAVRPDNPQIGKKWSEMLEEDVRQGTHWCYDYMIAAVCKVKRQFHDAHANYNDAVKDILNKLAIVLKDHLNTNCDFCKPRDENPEILPPYKVKMWLYAISDWLLQRVGPPRHAWKLPFLTSDRFQKEIGDIQKFLRDCEVYESTGRTEGQ